MRIRIRILHKTEFIGYPDWFDNTARGEIRYPAGILELEVYLAKWRLSWFFLCRGQKTSYLWKVVICIFYEFEFGFE